MLKLSIGIDLSKRMALEFELLPPKLRKAILRLVEEILKHVVEKSRLNAPIRTGALRQSISYERPRIVSSGHIVGAVGSNLPYALRWHEEPFKLGPISAKQGTTAEGGVGNKYIARAIDYRREKYAEVIMAALLEAIEKNDYDGARAKKLD